MRGPLATGAQQPCGALAGPTGVVDDLSCAMHYKRDLIGHATRWTCQGLRGTRAGSMMLLA